MQLKETIEGIVLGHLNESHFVVDIIIAGTQAKPKITILLDGDEGILIDYCAEISRKTSNELEEKNIIDTAYTIEVSSPGIGYPLKYHRQYVNNIGRGLQIELNDGKIIDGKLEKVEEEILTISTGNKMQAGGHSTEININDIKKSVVTISFG